MNRYERSRLDGHRGFATGPLALILLFLLTVAGIAWVSLGIVTSERWPIRWLEVNGAFQRVSAEQLRANLSSRVGTNFFTVDLQDLRDAAMRISWVSAVRVRKQWPDTLRVEVEEYVPVAHWNRGQLIAKTGAPFTVPEADTIQGLPWLSGPEGRLDEVLERWTDINRMLNPLGREIDSIRLDRRGAWSMASRRCSTAVWSSVMRCSVVTRRSSTSRRNDSSAPCASAPSIDVWRNATSNRRISSAPSTCSTSSAGATPPTRTSPRASRGCASSAARRPARPARRACRAG